ncbi:hypothetical protein CU098_012062, partial [Rhizopus stolonifer]
MVQHVTLKRQKLSHTNASNKAARYSSFFNFSSLTCKQSPQALSISKQNILISAPIQPIPNQIHLIAGDLYNHNCIYVQKTHVEIIQKHHKQRALTHMEWNQKGNAFASIDETGQLALWKLEGPIENWKLEYSVDLKQPLAAFIWLNAERQYTDNLVREPKAYFRNPYGYLGFLTVTIHGEITVHYQRSGALFSSFSAHIPMTNQQDLKRSDASCFSMSLSGIDNWQHISHAAIILERNVIYLATHYASSQPRIVQIHTIDIKFPIMEKKGGIRCRQIASVCPEEDDLFVTQIGFKKTDHDPQLYLGLGKETPEGWNGCVQQWELKQRESSFPLDVGNTLKNCISNIHIEGKFITCLKSIKDGSMVMGLSDGSIHLESSKQGLLKNNESSSYAPNFWCIVEPKGLDAIVDLVFSPNETHILYMHVSGKIGIARATHDTLEEEHVDALITKFQYCLFNNVDTIDLISELVRLSKQPGSGDKPTEIIDNVLTAYEAHCQDQVEEWNVGQLQKAYGLALAALNRLPNKQIQSINLSRGMQLPVILECFISSCSNYKNVMKVFNKEQVHLEFEPNSLWSLTLLSTWIFNFVKWVLHEWDMLLHSKRSQVTDVEDKSVHSVLFVHKESRGYLIKILTLIQHFIQFTNNVNYQLDHLPESQPVLQRYTKTLQNETPIKIEELTCMIIANNRWSTLLRSTLKGYSIPNLQNISAKYKDKCTKPCLYIEKEIIGDYDPIRKRNITGDVKTNLCIRCHQHILPVNTEADTLDPCSSAQWYQSLSRRCIC